MDVYIWVNRIFFVQFVKKNWKWVLTNSSGAFCSPLFHECEVKISQLPHIGKPRYPSINFDFSCPGRYWRKITENQFKSTHIIHRWTDLDERYLPVYIIAHNSLTYHQETVKHPLERRKVAKQESSVYRLACY